MKHEQLVKRILTELHEQWMDDFDKAEFDAEIMRLFGAQLDSDIDNGIANGYTEEQQEGIVRSLFRQKRNSGKSGKCNHGDETMRLITGNKREDLEELVKQLRAHGAGG